MSAAWLVAPPISSATPTERVIEELDAADTGGSAGWCVPLLGTDLGAQWAVEQELAREGLDREALDGAELGARARLQADQASTRLGEALSLRHPPFLLPPADASEPAQAAFVALYEAGLVDLVETVLPRCPRCRDVLGDGDTRTTTAATGSVVLRVALDDGTAGLEVEDAAAELLGAVSAVGVPPDFPADGRPASGRSATVPLTGQVVPVVEDPAFRAPTLVRPGHDPAHWALARRCGLPAPVLPDDPAPYASREAALERLAAEGRIVAHRTRDEEVTACAHCGTLAEARLAAHWILDGRSLADALPPELADHIPPAAGQDPWCLDRELWLGVPLPLGWCAECAKPTVAVASTGSCGICFGELRPDAGVLDPLFVAAAWAAEAVQQSGGVFVGGGRHWLVAALALALRLQAAPLSVVPGGMQA